MNDSNDDIDNSSGRKDGDGDKGDNPYNYDGTDEDDRRSY